MSKETESGNLTTEQALEKAQNDLAASVEQVSTLTSERDAATARAEKAEGDLQVANSNLANVQSDLEAAEQLADDEREAKEEAETKLKAAEAERDALKAKDRDIDAEVSAGVAAAAASTGGKPLAQSPDNGGSSAPAAKEVSLQELYDELAKIEDPDEKRAFYVKNIKNYGAQNG